MRDFLYDECSYVCTVLHNYITLAEANSSAQIVLRVSFRYTVHYRVIAILCEIRAELSFGEMNNSFIGVNSKIMIHPFRVPIIRLNQSNHVPSIMNIQTK